MEGILMALATVYSVVSYIIGIVDLIRLKKKMKKLANVTMSDLEEFLGVHNYIFIPSCLIILVVAGIIKLLKRVFN